MTEPEPQVAAPTDEENDTIYTGEYVDEDEDA